MNVVLSMKPKYANAILNGEKEYEFRKVIFRDTCVQKVYIYSSSPVQKIVGTFTVGDIIEDHPARLWKRCRDKSGITEEDFFTYFNDSMKGYAIKIDEPEPMENPIDPRNIIRDFVPPQSFCYIDIPLIGGQVDG